MLAGAKGERTYYNLRAQAQAWHCVTEETGLQWCLNVERDIKRGLICSKSVVWEKANQLE